MLHLHQLYMIWFAEVLVNDDTRTTNLENASGAHPNICYTRDGADMHLFLAISHRAQRALELRS